MRQFELTVTLDKDMLPKLIGYYLYRSEEFEGKRPIVDGLYVQRDSIGPYPPDSMELTLTW